MSASDFASITQNGDLCDETGQLGPAHFENVMRKQARRFRACRDSKRKPESRLEHFRRS